MRTPPLHDQLDRATEILLYVAILSAPWAFGAAMKSVVWALNFMCLGLGGLLLAKQCLRWRMQFEPTRWGASDSPHEQRKGVGRALSIGLLSMGTLAILYTAVAAINKRVTYNAADQSPIYHDAIPWLPKSYDAQETWFAFWSYIGLAFLFFALRDWLLAKTPNERRLFRDAETAPDDAGDQRRVIMPERLHRLLWALAIHGAVLSLVSIVQRLDGGSKLLWILQPTLNRTAEMQFGPFAYRGNGAQYLNLLWPVILGFWWAMHRSLGTSGLARPRVGQDAHIVLLPLAVICSAGPLISASRGGVLLALAGLGVVVVWFVSLSNHLSMGQRIGATVAIAATLGVGWYAGWDTLKERLNKPAYKYATETKVKTIREFTLVSELDVDVLDQGTVRYFPSLSAVARRLASPRSVVCRTEPDGRLRVTLFGRSNRDRRDLVVQDFIQRYEGQSVVLVVTKSATGIGIWTNGEAETYDETTAGLAPDAKTHVAASFLWTGVDTSAKSAGGYVSNATVFDVALSPEALEQWRLLGDESQLPKPIFDRDFTRNAPIQILASAMSGRDEIYNTSKMIARDNPTFGIGPGAYGSVYQFYIENDYETWAAYAHDDYLEGRITWGWVGMIFVLAIPVLAFANWFAGTGVRMYLPFAGCLWLSLGLCLIHARFDFPFQIHSITMLFATNLGILSVVSRR